MSLKSFFSKIIPGKKETDIPAEEEKQDDIIQHEISFDKMETRTDTPGIKRNAEIDVYINNEKINIHTLAEETRIGRDPSQSDIIISELIVSKLHCTIYDDGDTHFIRDDGSTNGVYMDGEKVTQKELQNGDTILLGKKGTVKIIYHKP
jgi:FHA domain